MENISFLVEEFCKGDYDHEVSDTCWISVFRYILHNYDKLELDKDRIHLLWTVNGGHLRRKIQDDELIAKVLRIVLPGYTGKGLVLYRGECGFLYESGKLGFCWTPYIKVAERFACGLNSIESNGVLLKAFAPSAAILSSPNDHSSRQMQEFEYTCDPDFLEKIELICTYEKH